METTKKTLTVMGVPEHFNYPFHYGIEQDIFKQKGIHVNWQDCPGGTGAMCQAIANNEVDIVIGLTEGMVKAIDGGLKAKILQTYVESPLIWGVHVAKNSPYKTLKDLEDRKIAISRYGSGSHLMAYVQAQQNQWNTHQLNFEVVNNLQGGIDSLTKGDADYFMWEHFTTKPLVDQGIFRRVADCPTPWSCFVIVANQKSIASKEKTIFEFIEELNKITSEVKTHKNLSQTLSDRYDIQQNDIEKWLSITQWSQSQLSQQTLHEVQKTLLDIELINDIKNKEVFLY